MAVMILSPLNKRRLSNFKDNKRGYWSLVIFTILLVICLFAELIANDKPLFVKYGNNWYIPIFSNHSETTYGGEFDIETDFHDPYIRNKIDDHGFAIWPLIPFSYATIDFEMRTPQPSPPSMRHLLGTDELGRDVLARLIYGFRISILFGLALTAISSVIGIALGAVQGYFGGWVDLGLQRVIEIWSGLPQLFVLIILASLFAPGFWTLLFIMLLFSWMSLTGLVRVEFLRARNFEYVRAAKALGMNNYQVMYRHVLPNAMVATITFLPFVLNGSIVALTSLDFLSLGMPPGSPSLGELLSQGKNNLQAPWLGITAFFAIAIMLSLLIFIGEAIRDAFDPRKTF